MYKRTIALLFLLHTISPSAAAAPSETEPLVVESSKVSSYWTADPRPFSPAGVTQLRGVKSTEVEVAYTINKNGKVTDVEVLSAKPENTNATWAVRAIKASRFIASASNADHTPIRSTATVTLNAESAN
ncbi:TonB family C-terminal domain-containing protein [Pseudoxanthomonas sp. GM95]|uniref:hypothetical protein n=1 Tax=Pseudoxanthomonas sp. GM95 TaxID=1881043 RepID=UPI0008D8943D|nr:hypothetical protein [Pseudoxanthomonas sp. GM95]SEM09817.1 TonB family C-terminal domain-containing protein [Pseudoxanthomonas sp. GM95]